MNVHNSTRWLVGLLIVVGLTGLLAAPIGLGHAVPLVLPYNWHKWLHILGAILFLGNIIVTGGWMFLAERSGNESTIRFAAVAVNWADVFFTAPGVILLLGNGILLSQQWGGLVQMAWIRIGLILFTLSGVVWVAGSIPTQDRLARWAAISGPLPVSFFRALHWWYFWGIVATLLPLVSMMLMVVKPG
jgi:uncharacterized membrane protein